MAERMWAALDVVPSLRGLKSTLEREGASDALTAGRTVGRQYGDAIGDEAGKRAGSGIALGIKQALLVGGAGAAGGLLGGLLRSAKNLASEAEQAVGGVEAVFKEHADGILAASEAAEQGLGLSRSAYQELATLSGALLKNKGIEDFANQAQRLIDLGGDLAAQYGGSTKEAVEAINSALRGENNPIERYAITLNEATIQAELAAKGITGLTGAELEQAKTMARVDILMRQSADALGARAREAGTAQVAEENLRAQWENQRAELGQKLLPVYTGFIQTMNTGVLPAMSKSAGVAADLAGALNDLPGPLKAIAGGFVAIKAASALGITSAIASGAQAAGAQLSYMASAWQQVAAHSGRGTATLQAAQYGIGQLTGKVGKATGALLALAAAYAAVQLLDKDLGSGEIRRYVEEVDALAGVEVEAKMKSIRSEIEKLEALDKKNEGGFWNVLKPPDWMRTSDEEQKIDALREHLAELEHQQKMNALSASDAASANLGLQDALGGVPAFVESGVGAIYDLADAMGLSKVQSSELQSMLDALPKNVRIQFETNAHSAILEIAAVQRAMIALAGSQAAIGGAAVTGAAMAAATIRSSQILNSMRVTGASASGSGSGGSSSASASKAIRNALKKYEGRLERQEESLDRYRDAMDDATDALRSETAKRDDVLSAMDDLAASIRSQYSTNPFEASGSIWSTSSAGSDWRSALADDIADYRALDSARASLAKTLGPEALEYALRNAGLGDLQALAGSPADAKAYNALFYDREGWADRVGAAAGQDVYGAELRAQTKAMQGAEAYLRRVEGQMATVEKAIAGTNKILDRVEALAKKNPSATGSAVASAINKASGNAAKSTKR